MHLICLSVNTRMFEVTLFKNRQKHSNMHPLFTGQFSGETQLAVSFLDFSTSSCSKTEPGNTWWIFYYQMSLLSPNQSFQEQKGTKIIELNAKKSPSIFDPPNTS